VFRFGPEYGTETAFTTPLHHAWTKLQHRLRIRSAQPRLEGLTHLGLAGWAAITGARSDRQDTASQFAALVTRHDDRGGARNR
jgi:hypothetical protein